MSELADRSGVSAGTIKHYLREELLGGSDEIVRTSRNMAYCPPEYVERIRLIKRLQEERFMPLRHIRRVLADDPQRARALVEIEIASSSARRPAARRGASAPRRSGAATTCPATSWTAWPRSAC